MLALDGEREVVLGPRSAPVALTLSLDGPVVIDPIARRTTLRGVELDLTTYEFDLLRVLVEQAGRVLTREQLIDLVGHDGNVATGESLLEIFQQQVCSLRGLQIFSGRHTVVAGIV